MDTETISFRALRLHDWRQFGSIELLFHERLTVITGANAAGKTTLLDLLASHFGWNHQFVGTPARRKRGRPLSFLSGLWRRASLSDQQTAAEIGGIEYSNGETCTLRVPDQLAGPAFSISYDGQQGVSGMFIPSHRPAFSYTAVNQIPTDLGGRAEIISRYLDESRARWAGGASSYTPVYRLKEALISMATFSYGNQVVEEDRETVELYEGFIATLRQVLPPSLGFSNLTIRNRSEVVLETSSGDFPIDAVSGGVAAIIDLAFQIYMHDISRSRFVVVIDEPENHLHPELQRSLLPGFLEAFPAAQFIVATHSPFVVGSVEKSHVHVLRYGPTDPGSEDDRREKVFSTLLDTVNTAGNSNEILRDVLGLKATMPLWAERELEGLVSRLLEEPLSAETIRRAREELGRIGLEDALPETVERLVKSDPID